MRTLPEFIRDGEIGEHEEVFYWTRRALYEVVEEWSEGLFFAVCWVLFILDMAESFDAPSLLWGLFFLVLPASYIAYETLLWWREVYVVTEFHHDKGGTLYKFELGKKFQNKVHPIAINAGFGGMSSETSFWMGQWGNLTGERMERLTVSAGGNAFVGGSRLPLQLRRAVQIVKGSPPNRALEDDPRVVQYSRELRSAMMSGAIPLPYGERMLQVMWNQVLEGGFRGVERD